MEEDRAERSAGSRGAGSRTPAAGRSRPRSTGPRRAPARVRSRGTSARGPRRPGRPGGGSSRPRGARPISPPASIAAPRPSQALPVETVVEKPATAPISIIPSTPRFRTPARSAKISPIAANSSTVPVAMPRGERGSVQVHRGQAGPAGPPVRSIRTRYRMNTSATIRQNRMIALDHRRDAGRLDLAAGQDQRPEQDRGDDDPSGVEPGEVRDDDRGEAVARRDVVLEPVDRARRPRSSRPDRRARPRSRTRR